MIVFFGVFVAAVVGGMLLVERTGRNPGWLVGTLVFLLALVVAVIVTGLVYG